MREYIKCVIMLLWAPCLLMPLLLVCNREEINFILWHFKSSLQVHRFKSYLIPRTGFRLSEQTKSFQSVQLDCSAINTFVQKTRGAKWAKHFPFLKQSLYIKEGCWKCCGFWRISVLKCLVIRCEVSMFPTSKVPFSCHTTCMYRRSMRYDCKVYI